MESSRTPIAEGNPDAGRRAPAVVAYDANGVVTHWDPAAERIFGWTAVEAVGNRLPCVPAEKQAEFEELLRLALRGEAFTEAALQRRDADGSPVIVSVSAAPLREPDGRIGGVVEILTDVTDRTAEEETRTRLLAAVEQTEDSIIVTDARGVIQYVNAAFERKTGFPRKDAIGQFYRKPWEAIGRGESWRGTLVNRKKDGTLLKEEAVVSPVRDPSGRVTSCMSVQRELPPSREPGDRPVRKKSEGRQESGFLLFEPRPLDMNHVLKGMERLLRRLAGEGVELSMSPGRNLDPVMAVPGKVEQLIAGLLVHGRSALPRGGRISIRTGNVELPPSGDPSHPGVPPGCHVLLSIEADGEGIRRENAAAPPEAVGIARASGGRIRAGGPSPQGVGFHVYLPRHTPSDAEREAAARNRLGSLKGGSGTILIVEDEDVVRLPAGEILRSCGYTVIEARNGKEALLLSEAHPGKIDLLLTDVMMPKMDGRELARRMRERRPETKALLMSGYGGQDPVDGPGNRIAFLQKPFTAEALSLKVREAIDS